VGARLWLPAGLPPRPFPRDERDILLNRLWTARYLVPRAETLELSHLRDIVNYAEERTRQELERQRRIVTPPQKMSREQVKGALKEYLDWRKRKTGR